MPSEETRIAVMEANYEHIKESLERIDKKLDTCYVTVQEFNPVKRIVYGVVTLVLTAVLVAIVAVVVK